MAALLHEPVAQRDDDETSTPTADAPSPDTGGQTISIGPLDREIPLPSQDPIEVAPQVGDFPQPDPNAPTAQADEDPHPSADIAVQVPFSYQATVIYRNLNLKTIESLHLDLLHEPSISLVISPSSGLAVQQAITLINWDWVPKVWPHVEVGLSAIAQQTILNARRPDGSGGPGPSYGGQLQIEQHTVPWFSITLNLSGMYTPGQPNKPGHLDVGPAIGGVIHFP